MITRAAAMAVLAVSVGACSYYDGEKWVNTGHAQQDGKTYWEVDATYQGTSSREFHAGLNVPGALRIEARDYGSTHDGARAVALRYGRQVDSRTQYGLKLGYSEDTSAGEITVGAIGTEAITGEFQSYYSYDVTVEARRYISQAEERELGAWRPFIAGEVGVAYVEEIDATFRSTGFDNLGLDGFPLNADDTAVTTIRTPFYDDSVVPTLALKGGVSYALAPDFSIEVEAGVRYDGRLNEADQPESDSFPPGAGLVTLGLQEINDTGVRITYPVTLRGRYRF